MGQHTILGWWDSPMVFCLVLIFSCWFWSLLVRMGVIGNHSFPLGECMQKFEDVCLMHEVNLIWWYLVEVVDSKDFEGIVWGGSEFRLENDPWKSVWISPPCWNYGCGVGLIGKYAWFLLDVFWWIKVNHCRKYVVLVWILDVRYPIEVFLSSHSNVIYFLSSCDVQWLHCIHVCNWCRCTHGHVWIEWEVFQVSWWTTFCELGLFS